jgi:hypothetical protein
MAWHYAQNGLRVGPVTSSQFEELVRAGTITPDTLVWREGMADWQPYRSMGPPPLVLTPPPIGEVLCAECGRSFPQTDVISYDKFWVCAACKPVFFQKVREGLHPAGAAVWRMDRTLVMARETALPDRCVKCNAPANGRRLRRRLSWHHPAIYLIILCGLLVYVIVALIIRKQAVIEIGLCERHWTKRKWSILIAWMMVVGGLGLLAGGVAGGSTMDGALGAVLVLAALFYSAITTPMVTAKRIDDKHVWLGGVCRRYLDTLPKWSGS